MESNEVSKVQFFISWVTNHKAVTIFIFIFSIYIGLGSFIDASEKISKGFTWIQSKISPEEIYVVTLLVPASMSNAEVKVDNKGVDVIKRTSNFIIINLQSTSKSRDFIIEHEGRTCRTDKSISKDNLQVIFNC